MSPAGKDAPARAADRLSQAPGPIVFVVVGLAYLALTQTVMALGDPTTYGASLWPAAGLALAALLLVPPQLWGWALGAVAVAEVGGDLAWGYPPGAALGWTLASTVEALLAASLLRRLGNPRGDLAPVGRLLRFLAVGVVVGPLVGATIAAGATALNLGASYGQVWPGYVVGDALGVLVVAPLLLAAHGSELSRSLRERILLVGSTVLVSVAVFGGLGSWMVTMPYLLIPFFAWAALRFGTVGTAWISVVVATMAGAFTAAGQGPFVHAGGAADTAVTLLQVFLAITVSFALLLAALVSDLSDRQLIEGTLRHEATHDPLTGLPNRSRFAEELEQVLAATQTTGETVGLLVCDLDRLKAVNDRLGHQGGDDLLVRVAERLRAGVRPDDLVARVSGDEFVVLLTDVDEETVQRVARRLVELVAQPVLLAAEREMRPSISVGAAVAEPGESAEALFRVADAALYQAKSQGRGRVVVVDDGLRQKSRAQVRDEGDLPVAFEQGQLVCYFQPVVELAAGALAGVEATVRWRHPDLGILDAERFLPAVEAMGLGDRLFETVLDQTLRAQAGWEAETGQRPRVSVNVSSLQLGGTGVVDVVLRALAEHDAPPDGVCVEVTGTSPLDDVAVAVLCQLNALGVHLVLDGFGTGWTSLERLARIPWEVLKIDRAFVADLGEDPGTTDLVRAMVAMARALHIRAGAEGVTRKSQLEILADLGCEVAQGPLFSRPEPADELRRMLETGRVWVGEDLARRTEAPELAADH